MHKKVQDFRDKRRLLKSHLQQRNFFHFPQLTALIDSKEIQVDDMPIDLFSSAFDAVLQDFADRFQDFERLSATLRLAAFPHVVENDSAPLHLQMEPVVLKDNVQLVKKFRRRKSAGFVEECI